MTNLETGFVYELNNGELLVLLYFSHGIRPVWQPVGKPTERYVLNDARHITRRVRQATLYDTNGQLD